MIATLCIRCGKSRIFKNTWNELVGTSEVTYTQSVCPDSACQKTVEKLLKDKHDIFVNRLEASLKRRKENISKSVMMRKANLLQKEVDKSKNKVFRKS
ncbi:MAG: hypothetical protein AAB874_08070 [Patescibacteria group bacterium]